MKFSSKIFLLAVGSFLSCVLIYFCGEKELANQLVIVPVIFALSSYFFSCCVKGDKNE